MTETEIIAMIRRDVEAQFPKTCSRCGVVFPTLAHFVRSCTHLGEPVSFDAEPGDWAPTRTTGVLALSNCPCGTTLSISSRRLPPAQLEALMRWAKAEVARRGIPMSELLAELRTKVDAAVLADAAMGELGTVRR